MDEQSATDQLNKNGTDVAPVPSRDHDADNRRPWSLAFFLILIPGFFLADLLHPAILNRRLFDVVNNASSHHYDMLDTIDILFAIVLSVAIVTVCVLTLLRKRKLLLRLTVLTYCFAIPIGLTEAFFQLFSIPKLYPPGMVRVVEPKPDVAPGISGPSRMTINHFGLRGPEPHGEPRKILCIGGSTTICTYLDDSETWPAVLMSYLNADSHHTPTCVENAGKNGLDLLHHIEFLKRCKISHEFSDCIVLCGVNDLEHSVRMPKNDRVALAPSHVFDVGGPDYPLTPHFKQAFLYKMFKSAVKRIIEKPEVESDDSEGEFYTERRKERQQATKDYPLPPLAEHCAFYKQCLVSLKNLCDEQGLHLILMTQPVLWRDDLPPELDRLLWSRPIGHTGQALSVESLAEGMKAFNDTLREFCHEANVELVDLAAALPKDNSVFYDDEHFNEDGARQVARLIADHFHAHNAP